MKKVVIIDKPLEKRVIEVDLKKEGERGEVWVLVVGKERGEYEVRVVVNHKAKRTVSEVLILGLAYRKSVLKLEGLIKVDKGMSGVEGYLEIKGWKVGGGEIWAKPELEIEEKEVKVAHAASVGEMDRGQLEYLISRGISRKTAEKMMVEGLVSRVVDKVGDEERRQEVKNMIKS